MRLPARIILASASPRRRQLLAPHLKTKIFPANILERVRARENPQIYVKRMAFEKWVAARAKHSLLKKTESEILLSADTIVVLGSRILGKPKNQVDAKKMLKALSGKTHSVLTSVCVGWTSERKPRFRKVVKTIVSFRSIQKSELQKYLRSGDWRGKAGAYAIQGNAAEFVHQINGSLTSVVGLPVTESLQAIAQAYAHRLFKS